MHRIKETGEMASTATMATMMKMLESLPEQIQERVLEHMREYIEDIRDEAKWDESFTRTQTNLVAAARQARKEIAEGKASPMDRKRL
jgi:glycerate-2-kinase